jgi:flagellar protein FlbD
MNGEKFYLNPTVLETIELTPDTLITSISGKKFYVNETVEQITEMLVAYYKKINARTPRMAKEKA